MFFTFMEVFTKSMQKGETLVFQAQTSSYIFLWQRWTSSKSSAQAQCVDWRWAGYGQQTPKKSTTQFPQEEHKR